MIYFGHHTGQKFTPGTGDEICYQELSDCSCCGTPECGIQSSTHRFRWDRSRTSTASTWLDSAETLTTQSSKYCDEYVCPSVSLSVPAYISKTARPFSAYYSREIAAGKKHLQNSPVRRRTSTRSQLITNFTTSGDTDDAFAAPDDPTKNNNGMMFSSEGEDNDLWVGGRCSDIGRGWWFNDCSRSRLNSDEDAYWDASAYVRSVSLARMLVKFD